MRLLSYYDLKDQHKKIIASIAKVAEEISNHEDEVFTVNPALIPKTEVETNIPF